MVPPSKESLFLEINLISAQGLRRPSGPRRLQAYAIIWLDHAIKLRTLVDRIGGENPTWNDKFLFLVPTQFLADESSSAVSIEIYASGGWYLPDSLVGAVRLLIGNLRLLSRRHLDRPVFEAVGIRRPSGRFHGVLNVGAAVLRSVSVVAARALALRPAIGYQELMEVRKNRRHAGETAPGDLHKPSPAPSTEHGSEGETDAGGVRAFCGPCALDFSRSARNLEQQLSWAAESPGHQLTP